MNQITEQAYTGRDNLAEWQLSVNGSVIDHSHITRIQLVVDESIIADSSANPAWFVLGNSGYIGLYLGQMGIPSGTHTAVLIVWDSTTIDGYRWDTQIYIQSHAY